MTEGLGALGNTLFRGSGWRHAGCRQSSGLGGSRRGFARRRIQRGERGADKKGARDYQFEWLHLTSANPSAELDPFVL
jgi:hypothetical protein